MNAVLSIDQFVHARAMLDTLRAKRKSSQKSIEIINSNIASNNSQKEYYQDQIIRIEKELDELRHKKITLFKLNSTTAKNYQDDIKNVEAIIHNQELWIGRYRILVTLLENRINDQLKLKRIQESSIEQLQSDLVTLELQYYKTNAHQDLIHSIEVESKQLTNKIMRLTKEIDNPELSNSKKRKIRTELDELKASRKHNDERITELRKQSNFVIKEVG